MQKAKAYAACRTSFRRVLTSAGTRRTPGTLTRIAPLFLAPPVRAKHPNAPLRAKQDCPCLAKPFPMPHPNGHNCTATSSCAAQRAVVQGLAPTCATQFSFPQAPDHVNGDSRPWSHAPNATFKHMCNWTMQPQADQIHALPAHAPNPCPSVAPPPA
jgi:hypothetical protein